MFTSRFAFFDYNFFGLTINNISYLYSLYPLFIFSNKSSTSIPWTSHASSIVSACDAGQPNQCIPDSINISAFSGAISNNSPIFVVLSIIFFLLEIYNLLLLFRLTTKKFAQRRSFIFRIN